MDVKEYIKDLETNQSYFMTLAREFPYPMQIYLPDGTLAFANSAFLREFKIPFAGLNENRYNILQDPTLNDFGVLDQVHLAFAGYPAEITDIPVPVHFFKRFFQIPSEEIELYYLDIKAIPIKDTIGVLTCVVIIYLVRRKNVGRADIALSKIYIEQHWMENFDLEKIAKAVSMSQYYFSRLFKKHTGMTPHEYYINIKMEKVKQGLLNENLTVEQVFESCGLQYHGHYAMVFKKLTGFNPMEYRNGLVHKCEQNDD